jgi:chromosome segregation ATPase
MGDDLKFIDFHQLQIENKKHVKDIDERNKKLLALKMTTGLLHLYSNFIGKTLQSLNDLKVKLEKAMELARKRGHDIEDKMDSVKNVEDEIASIQAECSKLKEEKRTLEAKMRKNQTHPKVTTNHDLILPRKWNTFKKSKNWRESEKSCTTSNAQST